MGNPLDGTGLKEQMKCWHYNDTLLVVPCSKSTGKPTAFVRLILNQCLVEPLETCPLGLKSKDKEKESLFYFACSENYCTMSLIQEKSSCDPSFEQLRPGALGGVFAVQGKSRWHYPKSSFI